MEHTLTDRHALFLKSALYTDFYRLDRKPLTFVYSSIFAKDGNRYLVASNGHVIHALRFDGVPDGFYALEGRGLRAVGGSDGWKYPDWIRLMSKAIDELKPVRKIRSIHLGLEDGSISNFTLISNCQFIDTQKFNSAIALTVSCRLFGDTKEYLTASTREILIVLEDGSKALIMPIEPRSI